uniref:Bifunctional dihydrofolate reductase-thymidylate synthase n=2 Tax=Aplanochytrium stocchinoi TaxID=215587 RepID=A0A7S3LMZ6_9STRA
MNVYCNFRKLFFFQNCRFCVPLFRRKMSTTTSSEPCIGLVVAIAEKDFGIGFEGKLPWRLPGELKYFKDLTTRTQKSDGSYQNAVVMGRKTWDSIPKKFRPLPGRLNIVLSQSPEDLVRTECEIPQEVPVCTSLENALQRLKDPALNCTVEKAFIIGGSTLYHKALREGICDELYVTKVHGSFKCDTFFPLVDFSAYQETTIPFAPKEIQEENGIEYEFKCYVKRQNSNAICRPVAPSSTAAMRHEEYQYLDLIREVVESGNVKGDRTGTGTLSVFGRTMRYSLRDNTMPLLTTKRTFWRGIAEELLWFIKGDTSAKSLQEKNIHIWDGNGSRDYLDSIGLTDREEGDLGPVYGFQWRHFGAEYKTMHDDYTGQGVDQLKKLVNTLKTNPNDRRMIISAWNPAAFHLMALPPCHMFAQFYVANGELSCQMYQRSADMGLGVPFNIASYSLLTHMLAQCTGLKPGEFVHVIGDCHVYSNHVEPLKEQLTREPRPFPKLKINTDCTDIDGFKYEDFEIVGYKPHKTIKMQMAV